MTLLRPPILLSFRVILALVIVAICIRVGCRNSTYCDKGGLLHIFDTTQWTVSSALQIRTGLDGGKGARQVVVGIDGDKF